MQPKSDVAVEPIRIFVGADRSQSLAFKVLEFSISRRTRRQVSVQSLDSVKLPPSPDPRYAARTGFSFARFAIPVLAGRTGRAIYFDADMLVLADIAELWDMPLKGAKVLCQEELPDRVAATAPAAGARRKKQCSVMLLDCARLDWDAPAIIGGLGAKYTYDQLMSELCILSESDVSYALPLRWNSLELLEPETALIHYTDMMTQPWVCAANPNGWKWAAELRAMQRAGKVAAADLQTEISLKFARPSLIEELESGLEAPYSRPYIDRLSAIDRSAGFKPHSALARSRPAAGNGWRSTISRLARRAIGPGG